MISARAFAFVVGGTILGCVPLRAESFPGPVPDMAAALRDGGTTAAPPGFVALCMHNPALCAKAAPAAPATVTLNEAARSALAAVNTEINIAISYESDEQHYGIANVWMPNAIGGRGDCKDYALAKRELLVGEGFPEKALRIAIVRTAQDELHAVLTVDTDRGDLVLDSATTEIRPWWQTGYRWLTRQSADDPLRWVTLAPGVRGQ
jgi:predicted transglutaminase-like cysteine proteinase